MPKDKTNKPADTSLEEEDTTLQFFESGDLEDNDIDITDDDDSIDLDSSLNDKEDVTSASDKFKSIQESEDNVDTKEKYKRSVYITKQTLDAIEQLSKLRNVTGSKIVEYAVALYFKNYFERDFIQLSDMELFTEELATLVSEHTQEVAHLAELVSRTLDAEMELPTDL